MELYEKFRVVPPEARKTIQEGRLKGKTDINAMWRIKRLTEVFGPCGFGWKYTIKQQRLEKADQDNTAAFVDIDLFVRDPKTKEWSEPIPGIGGNVFMRRENSGRLYVDDDCFKKALTDAISIAAKALGLGADVWFEQDVSKYEGAPASAPELVPPSHEAPQKPYLHPGHPMWPTYVNKAASTTKSFADIRALLETKYTISDADFGRLLTKAGKAYVDQTGTLRPVGFHQ